MTAPWFYNDVGEGELNNYSDKQNNLVLPGYIKCMLLNPSQGPSCNAPDTLSKIDEKLNIEGMNEDCSYLKDDINNCICLHGSR